MIARVLVMIEGCALNAHNSWLVDASLAKLPTNSYCNAAITSNYVAGLKNDPHHLSTLPLQVGAWPAHSPRLH